MSDENDDDDFGSNATGPAGGGGPEQDPADDDAGRSGRRPTLSDVIGADVDVPGPATSDLIDADDEHDPERAQRQLATMLSSRRVVNRATMRGVAAVLLLIAYFFATDQTPDDLGEVVGAAMIFSGLLDGRAWFAARASGESWVASTRILGTILAGVVVLAWPGATLGLLSRVIGLYLVVHAVSDLARASRRRNTDRRWRFVRGMVLLIGAGFVFGFPATAVGVVAGFMAVVWIGAGVIAIAYAVRGGDSADDAELDPFETMKIAAAWLRSREIGSKQRADLNDKLFYEGAQFRARLFRFFILMVLSVSIATFGVVQDSTATVIGAMLIAPLMTPIMGTAAALTMGWPKRAARSGLTVVFGMVLAIVTALLLVQFMPNIPEPITTSQVTSRVSPTMIDMFIALAAGAAGAFALSRPDVSDSLPGVAIAVALVPPLSVVGVTIEAGQYGDAAGAFLLFLTNLVSILLAGSVVFVLTGYTPLHRIMEQQEKIRMSMATIVLGAMLVVIPLFATGQKIASDALAYDEANAAVDMWLGDGTKFEVNDLDINGSTVTVEISGPGDPPTPQDLADMLSEQLARSVTLELSVVPEEMFKVESSG